MKAKILLIDDEVDFLKILKSVLEQNGYGVQTANSAREGMQQIVNNKFDLVITDVRMPGASGLVFSELAHMVGETPIIVLSGHVSYEDIPDAEKPPGIVTFLSKPIDQKTLCHAIENVLPKVQRIS